MRTRPRSEGARILSFGDHRPERILTNAELARMVDTSDGWISSRVGILERRVAAEDETPVDLAVKAGGKALAGSGVQPSEIDLVIVATCSMESSIPQAASQVAHRLGIDSPGAFDVNAACAGFCYALAVAGDAVRCGSARRVLVVGSEKMTQWIDWSDRSTCVLFADGAGAAVVGPSDRSGIGPVVWGSAGGKADALGIPDRHSFLRQNGKEVYLWASSLANVAVQACEQAGVPLRDLDAFVPHQANVRIIDAMARHLGLDDRVVVRDVVTSGNTSGASTPLALSRLIGRGEVPSGGHALLFGFGAGLSYAAQVVEIP